MDFKDKIKSLRLSQGATLEQIGTEVGVSKATVKRWESGEIANLRRDKIYKLAKALHTTPAYLMGWDKSSDLSPDTTLLSSEHSDILLSIDSPTREILDMLSDMTPEELALVKSRIQKIKESR